MDSFGSQYPKACPPCFFHGARECTMKDVTALQQPFHFKHNGLELR